MWFPTNNPQHPGFDTARNQQLNTATPQPPQQKGDGRCCNHRLPTPQSGGTGNKVTAVIAWGKRPVPFRTRKLRPTAPMVLHPGGCGRVGHRRTHTTGRGPNQHGWGLPHLTPPQPPLTSCRSSGNPRSRPTRHPPTPAHTRHANHQPPLTSCAYSGNPRSHPTRHPPTRAHPSRVAPQQLSGRWGRSRRM